MHVWENGLYGTMQPAIRVKIFVHWCIVYVHTLVLSEKYYYLNTDGNNIKVTWDLKYLFSLLLNNNFVSGLLRAATNSWKRLEILADNRICCPDHTVRKCFAILSPILICTIEVYVLVLMYTYKNRKWQAVLTQWWDSRFSVHDHAEWWSKFKKLMELSNCVEYKYCKINWKISELWRVIMLLLLRRKNNKAGLGIRSSVFWANRSFFAKYKQMSDFLKKTRDSLIISFLVNNLSHSLMVAHFWWATWVIQSHCSLKKRDWANRLFKKNVQKTYQKIQF